MFRTNKLLLIIVLIAVLLGIEATTSIANAQVPALDRQVPVKLTEIELTEYSSGFWWGCFGQSQAVRDGAVMVLETCGSTDTVMASLLLPSVEPVSLDLDAEALPGAAALLPVPAAEAGRVKLERADLPGAAALMPAPTTVDAPVVHLAIPSEDTTPAKLERLPVPVAIDVPTVHMAIPSEDTTPAKLERMPVPAAVETSAASKVEPLFVIPVGSDIRVRTQPVNGQIVDVIAEGEVVQVVESAEDAANKIGAQGEWLAVRTLDGTEGYTAAWLYTVPHAVAPSVVDAAEATPVPTVSPQSASSAVFYAVALNDGVRVRSRPIDGTVIDVLASGEAIQVTESVEAAKNKIGVHGEWLEARTMDGTNGFTAAWLYAPLNEPTTPDATTPDAVTTQAAATDTVAPAADESLVLASNTTSAAASVDAAAVETTTTVNPGNAAINAASAADTVTTVAPNTVSVANAIGTGSNARFANASTITVDTERLAALFMRAEASDVRIRARPVNGDVIDVVGQGEIIQVVEPAAPARAKVGVPDQWVRVRTASGLEGYTAAWLYNIEDTTVPDASLLSVSEVSGTGSDLTAATRLFITPKGDAIRVRTSPITGEIVSLVNTGDLVEVLEPVDVALPKVGVDGQWVEVRDPNGDSGYTAAWLYDVAEMMPVDTDVAVAPLAEEAGTTDLALVEDGTGAASDEVIANQPIPPLDNTISSLGVSEATKAAAAAAAASSNAASAASSTGGTSTATTNTPLLPFDVDAEAEPDVAADPQTVTGELVNPIMPVTVDVVDDVTIHRAQLAVNNYPLATFTTPPFEFDLDTSLLSAGEYQLSFTVENVEGMVWSDEVFFDVELEDTAAEEAAAALDSDVAIDGAAIAESAIAPQPDAVNITALTGDETDALRRIVTIGGAPQTAFNFEFSIDGGLAPVAVATPQTESLLDTNPETLVDVLTTPFLSLVPAPVRTWLLAEHSTAAAVIILAMVLILLPQGIFTLYWMTYTWNNPKAAEQYRSPREFTEPQFSFTALLPARHEEAVIKDTIRAVDRIDYPDHLKEILILIRDEDDDETIRAAQEAIDELNKPNIRLITFTDGPRNKPNGLNKGLRASTHDVVCIFDAEDEPHPDVYNVVNTVMIRDEADVVQSGVQLMNFRSSWFAAFNVLEYFFWFKSGLHAFTRQFQVTPLGGNTVFFKRHWLERIDGWDDQCLTEDADVGLRLTQMGAKIQIVYDAEHSTQEETPDTVDSFIKQRTRWAQGFYQVFFKGDWLRLPTLKQKIVGLYILLNSLLQAAMIFFIPIGIVIALTQDVPVPVALISYIPIYILVLQLLTSLIGIREFAAAYDERLPMFFTLRMIIFYYPYQLLLSVAAFRAVIRMATRQQAWEKTSHSNLHRQSQLSGVA